MIALIGRGLLDRRRSLTIWSLSLGATGAFYMLLWPSIEDSVGEIAKSYPESLKKAFGVQSLSSAEQYLNAELFSLILPLALGIFAVRIVSNAIDGAQERRYLDVLLSAPVSRRSLVAATFAILAIELAVILFSAWAFTCLGSIAVGAGLDVGLAAAGFATVWPLAVFSAGVAMLVTGVSQHSATVTGIAAGTLVGMYLVDLLGRLSDTAEPVRVITVFKYYGAATIDGFDPVAFAGIAVAGILLAVAGTALFERRDIAG